MSIIMLVFPLCYTSREKLGCSVTCLTPLRQDRALHSSCRAAVNAALAGGASPFWCPGPPPAAGAAASPFAHPQAPGSLRRAGPALLRPAQPRGLGLGPGLGPPRPAPAGMKGAGLCGGAWAGSGCRWVPGRGRGREGRGAGVCWAGQGQPRVPQPRFLGAAALSRFVLPR